jgi:hypothetical protein
MNNWHELSRQCSVMNRDGKRCGRAPIRGGKVCCVHGGKAPQTVAAAKQRLLLMVEPAMDALYRILQHGPPCTACGRSDDDKNPVVVRAAQIVLDRCGCGPQMNVALSSPPDNDLSTLSLDELIERGERSLELLRSMRTARALPDAGVLDADTIEADAVVLPDDDETVEL